MGHDKDKHKHESKCKKITVGFADYIGGSLHDTKDAINTAFNKGLFPNIVRIKFAESLPLADDDSNLNAVVDSFEAAINKLISKGCHYILISGKSSFIAPWIRGTGGNLGGFNLQQRHGNVFFMLTNIGTDAYKEIGLTNCGKLLDTFNYGNLLSTYLKSNITGKGSLLFIFENGDLASESIKNNYAAAAATAGLKFSAFPINFVGSNFNPADLAAALIRINALPAGSIVAIAVNSEPSHQNSLSAQFNWAGVTSNPKFVGANFGPLTVSVPVDIFFPSVPSISPFFPPFIIKNLGNYFSNTTGNIANELFIEGMGYFDALACHEIYYGFDGRSRFDSFNSYVNYWIGETVIRAGTFISTFSGIPIENPRWTQTTSILPTPV